MAPRLDGDRVPEVLVVASGAQRVSPLRSRRSSGPSARSESNTWGATPELQWPCRGKAHLPRV
eukprot:9573581-Alexandrium_andersonii.AAC.1